MASRLVSSVRYPVRWDSSDHSLTFYGLQNLKSVTGGRGLFCFYQKGRTSARGGMYGQWIGDFGLSEKFPVEYALRSDAMTVSLSKIARSPCSGIITNTDEGYIIAPSLRLDISEGRDIVLMLLSPRTVPLDLSLTKASLTIPGEEANVTLSVSNGELRCAGSVSGRGVRGARIILDRNPGLPIYTHGFEEKLCQLKGAGVIATNWKPVTRVFEDFVIVFHPTKLWDFSFDDVRELLGVPEDDDMGPADFVIGDGHGTNYAIRLILDRSLGRHSSDEVRLLVS